MMDVGADIRTECHTHCSCAEGFWLCYIIKRLTVTRCVPLCHAVLLACVS